MMAPNFSVFERVERSIFFRITRVLTWVLLVASLLGLVVALGIIAKGYLQARPRTRVTAADVREANVAQRQREIQASRRGEVPPRETNPFALPERPGRDEAVENALDRVLLLFPRGFLELRRNLEAWLCRYQSSEEKLVVLEEMQAALTAFPENERVDAARLFVRLREFRENASAAAAAAGQSQVEKGAYFGLASLGTIAMFSLVLVLLNIERNTRDRRGASPS